MEEYEGETGLRFAQLLLLVALLAALVFQQKALGALIILLIAPWYTIVAITALACVEHFFPNSLPSVTTGWFEFVGFLWVGFKICIRLTERKRKKGEERQRQEEFRREAKKREHQEQRLRKLTENAKKEFEQAATDGRFPSEQALTTLADCDDDIAVDLKEAVEELLYGGCSLRSMTFGDAVRRIQQRQRVEQRARKRGSGAAQATAEPSGPVTQAEALVLLGLTPECTPDELTRAYHRKVSEWHPDKLQTMADELKALATQRTARLNEAYERLRSSRL
jgi:hypothetical protein